MPAPLMRVESERFDFFTRIMLIGGRRCGAETVLKIMEDEMSFTADVRCVTVTSKEVTSGIANAYQLPTGEIEYPFGQKAQSRLFKARIGINITNGLLAAVHPNQLDFGGRPLAPGLNFWPGGECAGYYKPFWVSKNCRDFQRKEWAIERLKFFSCEKENH
jgi:hypothetical protein